MEQAFLSSLEIHQILNRIAHELTTPYGTEFLRNIHFYSDAKFIETLLTEVDQAKDLIAFDDQPPFRSLEDLRPKLAELEPEDSFLETEHFIWIISHFESFQQLKRFFERKMEKIPSLMSFVNRLHPFNDELNDILRVMDKNGEIYDNASPELKQIRMEINALENQLKRQLEKLLSVYSDYLQDEIITLRDGRHVLAIQDIHYHKVPGIVHGMSGSGKTYFIEPLETLQLSNRLQDLKLKERKEIIRILKRLSQMIREKLDLLYQTLENLGYLDFVFAKARYAVKIQAHKPAISSREYFSIQNARHPLLIEKLGYEQVVPLTLYLGDDFRTLIITGANAGGKTVALKTVGMVVALTQMGILPPVEEGTELSVVPGLYVDIGDKQSIEEDLSTFSSHIAAMKQILTQVRKGSLVLLDELGTATDPDQGAALGMAIIDHFIRKECFVIVTTHLPQLKAYAAEKEGVENASMEFDVEKLEPRYRLQIGIPGASYAFEIARRFGLPAEVIQDARKYLGEQKISLEQMIVQLHQKMADYSEKLSELSKKESELKALEPLLRRRASAIKEEKARIKKEALAELDEFLRKKRVEAEQIIKDLRKNVRQIGEASQIKKKLDRIQEEVSLQEKQFEEVEELPDVHPGDWVKLKELNRLGMVITEPNEKGRLWVDFDGLKMQVQLSQLQKSEPPSEKTILPSSSAMVSFEKVKPEVDIRGLEVEEAIREVDEYLTNAMNAGWEEVRIIHGKGMGILRREIHKFLSRDKRILEKRLGRWGEGDTGVTIVKLRTSDILDR